MLRQTISARLHDAKKIYGTHKYTSSRNFLLSCKTPTHRSFPGECKHHLLQSTPAHRAAAIPRTEQVFCNHFCLQPTGCLVHTRTLPTCSQDQTRQPRRRRWFKQASARVVEMLAVWTGRLADEPSQVAPPLPAVVPDVRKTSADLGKASLGPRACSGSPPVPTPRLPPTPKHPNLRWLEVGSPPCLGGWGQKM